MSTSPSFLARVAYEDPYVQPLILDSLRSQLPAGAWKLIDSLPKSGSSNDATLQFCAYEALDFERAAYNAKNLINAYIIRKALIRKHYLSQTLFSWITKHPASVLRRHFKPAVDFELDYAEFLDDALVEAFELRAAFEKNEGKEPAEREWWILKPGMSDRGQGIRIFSTEEELQSIFEEWEAEQDDNSDSEHDEEATGGTDELLMNCGSAQSDREYIVMSHLRHFIAQPYIHPPLLIPQAPFNNRKFHIRTYVVAAGALRVYVYNNMLALFASLPYAPPWELTSISDDPEDPGDTESSIQRMRNIHLTNTCVQSSTGAAADEATSSATPDSSVHLFSSLPLTPAQHAAVRAQIHAVTAELFRAAVAHPTHFQPLPCAFEIYGLDFLLEATAASAGSGDDDDDDDDDGSGMRTQLLEVNAFPDFAQTGAELRDVVVKGLFEEVASRVIGPFFGLSVDDGGVDGGTAGLSETNASETPRMTLVLDLDLGRR